MTDIYKELVDKALPYIEAYKDDLLVYDKAQILAYPDAPFLHFTGDTGTLMVTLPGVEAYPKQGEVVPYLFGTADRWHILNGVVEQVKCVPRINRRDLMLYYDGEKLREVTYNEALGVVEDYHRDMIREF